MIHELIIVQVVVMAVSLTEHSMFLLPPPPNPLNLATPLLVTFRIGSLQQKNYCSALCKWVLSAMYVRLLIWDVQRTKILARSCSWCVWNVGNCWASYFIIRAVWSIKTFAIVCWVCVWCVSNVNLFLLLFPCRQCGLGSVKFLPIFAGDVCWDVDNCRASYSNSRAVCDP